MKKNNDIIKILIIVFAVLIVGFGIFMAIYLTTASKKIRSLNINPDFMESELGVGSEYTFTVTANPEKASLKKVKLVCDDENATFSMGKDGRASLVTGISEGTVTIYAEYKDIKSNVLSFQVVDMAARAQQEAAAQQAAAEAEAAAAAEAEAAAAAAEEVAPVKMYCKMTGDNVNVRSQNNTDCDVLGKAKKGDTYEKIEVVGDWTHIIFNGQDAYIKSEYLTDISEEEAGGGASEVAAEEKKEEKKEETKTENNNNAEQNAAEAVAQAAANAAAEAEAAQQQAAAELLAQQQAAAAMAAAAGTPIHCKDGTCYVTAAQLNKIHATWDFAGDAIEMAGHHSIGELEAVVGPTTH